MALPICDVTFVLPWPADRVQQTGFTKAGICLVRKSVLLSSAVLHRLRLLPSVLPGTRHVWITQRNIFSWQCGFPSELPVIVLAGYENQSPVAFVAATGPCSNMGPLYLSPFLSKTPTASVALPIAMVRSEARKIMTNRTNLLVFVEAGLTGESLLGCLDSIGMRRIPLGEYRIHSAMPRTEIPTSPFSR